MALVERGRTGVTTILAADTVTGLVTQDAYSPLHSADGWRAADGNVAYGIPFKILFYFTHTLTAAVQTTTTSVFSSNAPFKFRVIKGTYQSVATVRDPGNFETQLGNALIAVRSGNDPILGNTVASMIAGSVKDLQVGFVSNAEIDEDGSLSAAFTTSGTSATVGETMTSVLELECMRII